MSISEIITLVSEAAALLGVLTAGIISISKVMNGDKMSSAK